MMWVAFGDSKGGTINYLRYAMLRNVNSLNISAESFDITMEGILLNEDDAEKMVFEVRTFQNKGAMPEISRNGIYVTQTRSMPIARCDNLFEEMAFYFR